MRLEVWGVYMTTCWNMTPSNLVQTHTNIWE